MLHSKMPICQLIIHTENYLKDSNTKQQTAFCCDTLETFGAPGGQFALQSADMANQLYADIHFDQIGEFYFTLAEGVKRMSQRSRTIRSPMNNRKRPKLLHQVDSVLFF